MTANDAPPLTNYQRDTELARSVQGVLVNVPGLSEFESRLLASLIARRLQLEGWRK